MKESPKDDEEKQTLLYSESYPLNEKNERKKVKPISQVHKLLSGVKINQNKIYYKPLAPEHYDEVKNLHKEWFPVPYPEQIFQNTILFNQGQFLTQGAFYYLEEERKEIILGLILLQWMWIDKYFVDMVGENVLEEINKNIDYEEEAKLYLSKQKFYTSCYIISLGVIDECRKMNIGTSLIKDMMNYVVYFPFCRAMYLHVIDGNFSAIKFYEKNGLIRAKKIKDFYQIDDKKYDSYVYVKIFDARAIKLVEKYKNSNLNFKQKCFKYLILKPFYLLVKIFLLFCLCRCFKKKIVLDK